MSLDFDGAGHLTDYGTTLDAGYRADGLRAWKDSGAGRTYYLYDGETLVAELDGNGTVTSTHIWGADGLVMRGGEIYLCDPLGNVAVRTDLDGTVLASDAYDAWGNLLASKDPLGNDYTLTGDPYGYKAQYGYYTDRETGLILCTHRYYDPSTGRWLTRDPIGYEGGINLYQYCGNDPVNNFDPLGMDWVDDTANFCAGWGDALTLNATGRIRMWLGVNDVVDEESGQYFAGNIIGSIHASFVGAGAVVKGVAGIIWRMAPMKRGVIIDKLFRPVFNNLANNFPVIDKYRRGIATSIKSINLNSSAYRVTANLRNTLMRQVKNLSRFNGRKWGGSRIQLSDVKQRVLEIIIPNGGSAVQQAIMREVIAEACKFGVKVKFIIF